MIRIKVNKDIREYQPKVIFVFTMRQFKFAVFFLVAAALIFMILPVENTLDRGIYSAFIALPIIVCGYVDIGGIPAHIYAKLFVQSNVLQPRTRKFVQKNRYKRALEVTRFNDEETEPKESKRKMTRAERKEEKRIKLANEAYLRDHMPLR